MSALNRLRRKMLDRKKQSQLNNSNIKTSGESENVNDTNSSNSRTILPIAQQPTSQSSMDSDVQPSDENSSSNLVSGWNNSNNGSNICSDSKSNASTDGDNLQPVAGELLNKDQITYEMLNDEQRLAVNFAEHMLDFNLIGAAGTGKTTTVRCVVQKLSQCGRIGMLPESDHKTLHANTPAIAVLSYTNQAVRNIKEALPYEFKANCSTFHSILEFVPEYFEEDVVDEDGLETGETKSTMKFVPTYGCTPRYSDGKQQILPHLDLVVIEEAGSVPLELWELFWSALPNPEQTKVIMLGDLNQLPPVFDDAILGFFLLKNPIVELKHSYRNLGIVKKFAHRILEGRPLNDKEAAQWNTKDESGEVKIIKLPKRQEPDEAILSLGATFRKYIVEGKYNEKDSVVLMPFNKKVGTIEMNKWIGDGVRIRDGLEVHEVIAGFEKLYLAVGDKVLINKQYATISAIEKRSTYVGAKPLTPSKHLSRFGTYDKDYTPPEEDAFTESDDLDMILEQTAKELQSEKLSNSASHYITYEYIESETSYRTCAVGDIKNALPVWAMTVHKAQGSEFMNVYMLMHHTHAVMTNRELLYTGATRARKNLTIIYNGEHPRKLNDSILQKGITRQALAGKTIKEKLKYYRVKLKAMLLSKSSDEDRKQLAKDVLEADAVNQQKEIDEFLDSKI